MSTMEITKITESYVYMVKNKKTGHWYIGKQCDILKVIGRNYFTSSTSKNPLAKWFQGSFARDGKELTNWDIRILFQGEDYEEVEEVVIELMGLHHPENNPLSLNFCNTGAKWSSFGNVCVFDYILNKIIAVPQEEYYSRKQNGEVVFVIKYPEIKAKYCATSMENCGFPYPMQSPEIKAKYCATSMENCGFPYPMQSEEFKAKSRATNIENRGVPYPGQSPEIQAKFRATNIERYGVAMPLQSEEIQAKSKATHLEKYGVSHSSKSPEVRAKYRETCMKNHGVECTFQLSEVREKAKQTTLERYGVEHYAELISMAVVAFIEVDGDIQAIGVFKSHNKAQQIWSVDATGIGYCVRKTNERQSVGVYNNNTNAIVPNKELKLLRIGSRTPIPSETHPNLYRVKWMRLEDFQQTHPTVPLLSMEPPANDSQYIAPELSANS